MAKRWFEISKIGFTPLGTDFGKQFYFSKYYLSNGILVFHWCYIHTTYGHMTKNLHFGTFYG